MSNANVTPFETILKLCQQAAPQPWYPAEFAASLGLDDGRFRGPIQELTVAGLIEQAKWHPERGQGYRLTREGADIVNSPGLLAELRQNRTKERDDEPTARRDEPRSKLRDATNKPVVTYALLGVNVLLFLVAMNVALGGNWAQMNIRFFLLGGDAQAARVTGGATAAAIEDGQWWRLLTSMFVHRNFFDLFIPMSTFLTWGRVGEQFWGRWRFLLIYLVSGFIGTCMMLRQDPAVMPIGSYGAVFGVLASLAAWFALNSGRLPRETARHGLRQVMFALAWFVAWLLLMTWLAATKFLWAEYLGGALAGAFAAVLLNMRFTSIPGQVALGVAVTAIAAGAGFGTVRSFQSKPEWQDAVAVQRKNREKQDRDAEQRKKEKGEEGEIERFEKEILPAVKKASTFIKTDWEPVGVLCAEDPKRRDANDVAKSRRTVREAQEATDAALAKVEGFGNAEVGIVEKALIAARNYLTDQRKLLERAERALNAEEMTDKDKNALKEQAEQTQRSWRIYQQKLK